MIAPSGEQITILAKDQQAVVVAVGGGLRSYSVGGRELLDGYSANEMSSSGRGQVLIPWPNRLQDGSYEFNGRHHRRQGARRWYGLLTEIEDCTQALARLQQMQSDFARMDRVSMMRELAALLSHEITDGE